MFVSRVNDKGIFFSFRIFYCMTSVIPKVDRDPPLFKTLSFSREFTKRGTLICCSLYICHYAAIPKRPTWGSYVFLFLMCGGRVPSDASLKLNNLDAAKIFFAFLSQV